MNTSKDLPVAVIGAGGHAKVVVSTLEAAGFQIQGVYDDNSATWGSMVLGRPVRGPLAELRRAKLLAAVIAVGNNAARKRIEASLPHLHWATAVHPSAWVHPSVRLGQGTVVCAGAVIQPDSTVGTHVIVNTQASIDHDGTIGNYVHVAPGAHLAGGVRLGEGAFVGLGSSVVQSVQIGDWATIGAGGVVTEDIPNNVTAVGVPARPITRGY